MTKLLPITLSEFKPECVKVNSKINEDSKSKSTVAIYYRQDTKRQLSVVIPGVSCRFNTNKTSVEFDLNKNPDAMEFVDTLDDTIYQIACSKWNSKKWYVDDNRITSVEDLQDLYKTLSQTKTHNRQKIPVISAKLADKCAVLDTNGKPCTDINATLETLQTDESATATVVLNIKSVILKNTSFRTSIECKSIQIMDNSQPAAKEEELKGGESDSDFEELDEDA